MQQTERTKAIIMMELVFMRLLWAPTNFIIGLIDTIFGISEQPVGAIRTCFGALGILAVASLWFGTTLFTGFEWLFFLNVAVVSYPLLAYGMKLLLRDHIDAPFSYMNWSK